MTRFATLASVLLLALSFTAYGQLVDPNVAFCNTPASSSCTSDPNIITSGTGFGMFSIGGNNAQQPWFLFVAVPVATTGGSAGPAPTITSSSFTLQTPVDLGAFTPAINNTIDIYAWAAALPGTPIPSTWPSGLGNGSMNTTNMFGSAEASAFGATPAFFEIFAYEDSTEGFNGNTAYSFNANLVNGTFVGALAFKQTGNAAFSTPFTTAGLEDAPGNPNGGGGGGQVPEPFSVTLLATVCLIVGNIYRKKTRLN